LRSITGAGGVAMTNPTRSAKPPGIRPTWAGDVSPALGDATPPHQATADEKPVIEVIHGTKSVAVKPQ
jgi:hypothetical protein